MPLDTSIKKVMVIGSGPIVIGQAAEFDYAGTQACRVLRSEGIEIVLVNSNPATIMTDPASADHVYLEPLTVPTIRRIIEKERPDSILSGLGGQTGLTLCMQLAKHSFLDRMGVRLLGSSPAAIDMSEDRQLFKQTMQSISQPVIPSVTASYVGAALTFADEIGYPVIVRPAFTLGGSGGGAAADRKELSEIVTNGIAVSPIGQVLVEKSIAGWKEIEFEVMRDKAGNVITVCSMENFDPVGIHTGDSIVIAPAVTLSDKEYQMLRSAALNIITALGVEGGCNVQFALHPHSFEYAVIEVNPRVSRSSALASKATGYPIAKVAVKIALGYNLDEIINAVTGTTYAAFEPALDYVAVKVPRWPFDKFIYAKRDLGTQMKSTGEAMGISDTFEGALLKAVRGAEMGIETLDLPVLKSIPDSGIASMLDKATDKRLFVVYEAIRRGISIEHIHSVTNIDEWFLYKLRNIALSSANSSESAMSLPPDEDAYSPSISSVEAAPSLAAVARPAGKAVFKMVDTCSGEFEAQTPYFYSLDRSFIQEAGCAASPGEDEALPFIGKSGRKSVIVLGSGPIRIGQGIEFDYACVHCVMELRRLGYEAIVINNNPETVSTDFDTADRLYFEPLCFDDVMNVIETEKPLGVIVSYGGGTAIKLSGKLAGQGVPIIGTPFESIDICENRELFDRFLHNLEIRRPAGHSVFTAGQALKASADLGFPVLMRPSYVLGGQNMIIAHSPDDILEYMEIILAAGLDGPVLIDKYLSGLEIEVDAVCDGEGTLIPGIMEHVERTGVHSGDSISVYPAPHVDSRLSEKIFAITESICSSLKVKGLINIQFVLYKNELYIIEVNPRASRTVPFMSKVTGIPMCALATGASLGGNLISMGYKYGIAPLPAHVSVKVPVFSFEKLADLDTQLGPEMKSTGEVLGIGTDFQEALYKGLIASGYRMRKSGGVFISVRDSDKSEITAIAEKFSAMGFTLYATAGTGKVLAEAGLETINVNRIHQSENDNVMTLLASGKINYIISTSAKGRDPARDSVKMRRKACTLGIPCFTSLDTANAVAGSLHSGYSEEGTTLVDINSPAFSIKH